MPLPDLSRLPALGTAPLTTDTVAGVVSGSQQNGRWSLTQLSSVIGAGGFGPVINVKDFGALGNGTGNDQPAIQAALDAAFGPASAPHGATNKSLNKPVYFPGGEYRITAPLYLTHVVGGWIFGEGTSATKISYAGSLSGNTVAPASGGGGLPNANTITPIFMTNGFSYSTLEKMEFSISGTSSAVIYLFQDGTQGSTTTLILNELLIAAPTFGVLAGYQSSGLCSEVNYINCFFSGCGRGIALESGNALDHNVFGGGGNNSTVCCYACDSGQLNLVCGASLANNALDFSITSGNPTSIIGGRSESVNCLVVGNARVHVSGFTYQPGTPGTFVSANTGNAVLDACYSNPGAGAYVIAALGNTGIVIMDNMTSQSGSNGTISGTAGSKLYLRGCVFSNAGTITGFTGTVAQNI